VSSDDFLAQAIAQLAARLDDHVTAESGVLADLASKIGELYEWGKEYQHRAPAIDARLNEHERRIRRNELAVDDHAERLKELETLPRARPPHPSLRDLAELDEDDDEVDRTHPGGRRIVAEHRWRSMEEQQARTERALSQVREELDATERARQIETAAAKKVLADREAQQREDDARFRRRSTRAKAALAIAIPLGGALWEAARHLWPLLVH